MLPSAKKENTMTHNPQWPTGAEIKLSRGVFLAVALFFIPTIISDLAFFLGLDPEVDSVNDGLWLVILYSFISFVVLCVIRGIGKIELKTLFFSRIPSISEIMVWSGVGLLLGFFRFTGSLRLGHRFEEPQFVEFMILALILKSILWPLVEEPIYRGIFLVTLYKWKKNRLIAYGGSSLFFLFYHFISVIPLELMTLQYFHISFIIVVGLITAHLYDRKGSIWLCILVHGIPNGSDFLGALFGYLLGVKPP